MLAQRREEGVTVVRKGACRFVPLIGREAYAAAEANQGRG